MIRAFRHTTNAAATALRFPMAACAFSVLLFTAGWPLPPAHAQTPASTIVDIDLASAPLGEALNRYAQQTGVAIVFDATKVQGKQAPALRGRYDIEQGFAVLLEGSGLSVVNLGGGNYGLQPSVESGAMQLSTVRVASSYRPLNDGVSGNRSTVTQADVEAVQSSDLGDIFRSTPSVAVGGSLGIAEKIYVRGLEDALLNVTIDGATQAGVLFHHTGRLTVEPELLKQVDVHAGAGVATDGPGALGGSIRFVTKDPDDLLREGQRVGALLKAGYFDNTEGYRLSATVYGRLGDAWSAMASGARTDTGAITDGNGDRLAGTEAEQLMGFAKVVGRIGEAQTLRLGYERREDDGVRAQRPQWVISDWNPAYPLKLERETLTLNYRIEPASLSWLQFDATVYATRSEVQQNVVDRWGVYNGGTESRGINLRNTTALAQHELIYGVEYRDDRVDAGPAENPREQREEGDVLGFYMQDLYAITDRLLASAGLRYDRYELTDNQDQRFEADGVSPNAGISFQLMPGLSLNAAYAEALRGRQTTETFLLDSRTNAPDLKEEQARNLEAGFEYRRAALGFSGTVYRARIDDAINDQARVFRNIGDIETDGYDLRLSYDWEQVQAGLSYSNVDSELVNAEGNVDLNAYDHGALGNTIGNTWTLDIAHQFNAALGFGWNSRFVEGVDDVRTSAGTIDQPGYAVHDAYARWQPRRELTLTLSVLNLFDKDYIDHATNASYEHIEEYEGVVGLAEPGRDIRLTLAWQP